MYGCSHTKCDFITDNENVWKLHVESDHSTTESVPSVSQCAHTTPTKRFLACSSGGQRGIILTGMMKQLYANNPDNVKWDEMAGISAGAFCAAYVSQTTPHTFLPMIEKLHNGFNTKDFNVISPWVWGGAFINAVDALLFHTSLYSNDKMVKLIDNWFDPTQIKCPLHIGVYNKDSMQYETMSSTDGVHDMRAACLASAAIPTMLPTVKIGNDHYQDGGMRHIIPVKEIIDWVHRTPGSKHVDVLVCYPLDKQKFTNASIPKMKDGTVSSAVRMVSDLMLSQYQNDLTAIANLCNVTYDELVSNPCSLITHEDLTVRLLSPSDGTYTSILNIQPKDNDNLFRSGEESVTKLKL